MDGDHLEYAPQAPTAPRRAPSCSTARVSCKQFYDTQKWFVTFVTEVSLYSPRRMPEETPSGYFIVRFRLSP